MIIPVKHPRNAKRTPHTKSRPPGERAASARAEPTKRGDSEELVERVRELLAKDHGVSLSERRMFGVLAFLLAGNMLCYVSAHGLTVRLARDDKAAAAVGPKGERCVVSGRRMPGFVLVDYATLNTRRALATWLAAAADYVGSLPPKIGKA